MSNTFIVLCLAGFSQEMVRALSKRADAEFADAKKGNIRRIQRPLNESRRLDESEAKYYLDEASKAIEECSATADIRFLVIYAQSNIGNEEGFVEALFPMAITTPIEKEINVGPKGDGSKRANSNNNVETRVMKVLEASRRVRKQSNIVRDVTTPERKFLPFILPINNFKSGVAAAHLKSVYRNISSESDPTETIENCRKEINRFHPEGSSNKGEKGRAKFYRVDDRGMIFTSPGSDRHGQKRRIDIRKSGGHESKCFLKDRVRLGVAIDASFHFDCSPRKGGLPKSFTNCHDAEVSVERSTHANIAPSDFVR